MSNQGLDEVRVWASDVPDENIVITSTSHILSIGGETAVVKGTFGELDSRENHSRVRVPNSGNISCP